MKHMTATALALFVAVAAGGQAPADVKAGVDAWAQGDYSKAVSEWRPLAQAGDADAQFNLGQAYKLGRGVPTDLTAAMEWYRKAAVQGHARAEDNYGLLLFQQNHRQEAMPYLQRAADRDEPRAQYLVGTALFNGDLLPRDWVRAYALMARASGSGLPQASSALVHMDQYIPEGQRNDGLALAAAMEERARERQTALAAAPAKPAPVAAPTAKTALAPVRSTEIPSSANTAALAAAPAKQAAPPPKKASPAPAPLADKAPAKPAPATAKGGWRIQLGAFSEESRAETQWKALSAKVRTLSAYKHYVVKSGAVTRLQAGPLDSRTDADKLCNAVKAGGSDCIVKAM